MPPEHKSNLDSITTVKSKPSDRPAQYPQKTWVETAVVGPPLPGENVKEIPGGTNLVPPSHPSKRKSRASTASSVYSATQSQRFQAFLETKRISNRPFYIVRRSDSDILLLNQDNYDQNKREYLGKIVAVGILPADEMNGLTSEIKQWRKIKKTLRLLCWFTLVVGIAILTIALLLTFVWFAPYDWNGVQTFPNGNTRAFSSHMLSQTVMLFLMAFATMSFRLTKRVKLTWVTKGHAILSTLALGGILLGALYGILYHKVVGNAPVQFYTIHFWAAVLFYVNFAISFVSGIICHWCPFETVRSIHSGLSMSAFMFAGGTATVGYFSRALIQLGDVYTKISWPGVLINVQGLLIILFCCLVRLICSSFIFRRRPKPQWDVIVYRSMEAIEDVYLEIQDMYDSYELWMKQVNIARNRALHLMGDWNFAHENSPERGRLS